MTHLTTSEFKKLMATGNATVISETRVAKALRRQMQSSADDTDLNLEFAFQLKVHGIAHEREYTPGWGDVEHRWDFALIAYRIVVEVQGGIYQDPPSGHRSITGVVKDIRKLQLATLAGWITIQLTPEDVTTGRGLKIVEEVMQMQRERYASTADTLAKMALRRAIVSPNADRQWFMDTPMAAGWARQTGIQSEMSHSLLLQDKLRIVSTRAQGDGSIEFIYEPAFTDAEYEAAKAAAIASIGKDEKRNA